MGIDEPTEAVVGRTKGGYLREQSTENGPDLRQAERLVDLKLDGLLLQLLPLGGAQSGREQVEELGQQVQPSAGDAGHDQDRHGLLRQRRGAGRDHIIFRLDAEGNFVASGALEERFQMAHRILQHLMASNQ